MSTSIVIRFIRDMDNKSMDDTLYITPVWDPLSSEISVLEYRIHMKFSDDSEAISLERNINQTVSSNNLHKYLYSLFNVIAHDDEPFKGVQVDMPCAPSVVLNVSSLSCSIWSIMNLVEVTIDSWPKKGVPKHQFFKD